MCFCFRSIPSTVHVFTKISNNLRQTFTFPPNTSLFVHYYNFISAFDVYHYFAFVFVNVVRIKLLLLLSFFFRWLGTHTHTYIHIYHMKPCQLLVGSLCFSGVLRFGETASSWSRSVYSDNWPQRTKCEVDECVEIFLICGRKNILFLLLGKSSWL